jgi:hypothetical protein
MKWSGRLLRACENAADDRAKALETSFVSRRPDVQSPLTMLGTETVAMSPDEFTRVFHGDVQRVGEVRARDGSEARLGMRAEPLPCRPAPIRLKLFMWP